MKTFHDPGLVPGTGPMHRKLAPIPPEPWRRTTAGTLPWYEAKGNRSSPARVIVPPRSPTFQEFLSGEGLARHRKDFDAQWKCGVVRLCRGCTENDEDGDSHKLQEAGQCRESEPNAHCKLLGCASQVARQAVQSHPDSPVRCALEFVMHTLVRQEGPTRHSKLRVAAFGRSARPSKLPRKLLRILYLAPNHRAAACANSSSLGVAPLAQATIPSGRTSTALTPSSSFASDAKYAIRPLQRFASG